MTGYDAKDSAGFIRLFGLPLRGRKRINAELLSEVEAAGEAPVLHFAGGRG
jgi:hypothetical protein